MIRAVFDTNIIVSAMINPEGNEAVLLMAVNQGLVEPCFCEAILQEYSQVLRRPKFSFAMNEIDSLLGMFEERGLGLAVIEPVRISPDPDDDIFIACALKGSCQFLVTGNKKHFPAGRIANVKVVNAAELLKVIVLGLR